jgi:hypothetical protein
MDQGCSYIHYTYILFKIYFSEIPYTKQSEENEYKKKIAPKTRMNTVECEATKTNKNQTTEKIEKVRRGRWCAEEKRIE